MGDKLVSIVPELFNHFGEDVRSDAQRRAESFLEAVVVYDTSPVVLAPLVSENLAPVEDGNVNEIAVSFPPEGRLRVSFDE